MGAKIHVTSGDAVGPRLPSLGLAAGQATEVDEAALARAGFDSEQQAASKGDVGVNLAARPRTGKVAGDVGGR